MTSSSLLGSQGPSVGNPASFAPRLLDSLQTERVALLTCLLVGLIPIWAVERFPSVDGPVHLYIVFVLDQLAQPGTNVFDRVFLFNHYLEPNSTIYGLIWALSQVFPMQVAEKLFVSGYWLLFGGAAYYLMRAFGERAGITALLLLPFGLGYFLHWGFYNFVLSQALFLLGCGYALRHLPALRAKQLLILSLLMLVMAVTHLVGIALFLFFLGLVRLGLAWTEAMVPAEARPWRPALTRLARDALLLFLAALPALAIVASFLLRRVVGDDGASPPLSLFQKIGYVAAVSPIFSVDKREVYALVPFILVLWAVALRLLLAWWKDKALRMVALPALLPAVVLGLFVLVGSLGFAGFEGLPRLLPFVFFMLIIAFGALRLGALWRGAILVAVVGGSIGTALLHLAFYRQANATYAAFAASQPALPPGSAILAFGTTVQQREINGRPTGWRMNVTDHFRTTLARERNHVILNLAHVEPQIYGYFPVLYRPEAKVAAAYSAPGYAPQPEPLRRFECIVGLDIAQVSFWPLLDSEPGVHFLLEDREPLLRRELAQRWRPAPRTDSNAPFVFVERQDSTPAARQPC
jgi:hypothetical protein